MIGVSTDGKGEHVFTVAPVINRTEIREVAERREHRHTTDHVIRRGDSVWYLANKKFEVPIWLLHQYNPDIDFGALPSGAALIVPVIESRSEVEGRASTPAFAG